MPRKDKNKNHPPASTVFDLPPAPPNARHDGRSTLYSTALTHDAALRQTLADSSLRARAIPSAWVENDDPNDLTTLHLCNVRIRIPKPAEEDPVIKALSKQLDKDEAKFRAGRKDKIIGGELGATIHKRRFGKVVKKNAFRKSYANGELFKVIVGNYKSNKRRFDGDDHRGSKRFRKDDHWSDDEPEDFQAGYRNSIKEVVKLAKMRQERVIRQQRMLKLWSAGCARELRKKYMKPIRIADEAPRRARKIVKQVLAFWKKEDKERQVERKKVMDRAEEQRKADAEERENQRQKNKLKYLLNQSELFSSFLQSRDKATREGKQVGPAKSGLDKITGEETEEQLKEMGRGGAMQMWEKHMSKVQKFDNETKERKSAADANAAKRAKNKELVREAMSEMNGVADDDKKLIEDELKQGKEDAVMKDEDTNDVEAKAKPVLQNGKMIDPVRQPSILNCKMKGYQLLGLSWLVSLYQQGINGILADEMGLGKTLQTIALLAYLAEEQDNWGPFIVVTPKATLHNWQQEIVKFCEHLKVLPYWGSKTQRQELRKYWVQKRMYRRDSEFHVCITSYETLLQDNHYFPRVKWQYMILDEAQAIKNNSSARWKSLLEFPCRNRLLLTGTPLQNKLAELWSLLHFIMPSVFDSHTEFSDWFAKGIEKSVTQAKDRTKDKGAGYDETTLRRLRVLLDPFMLRRVKRDVESEMPPKTEVILNCHLSGRQRQLYEKVKANVSITELVNSVGGASGADSDRNSKLMNIVMQMRKVCNHPETFERRDAISPFQCQRKPPPFHTPHPPSVLTGGTASLPPLDVTMLTRSAVTVKAPRAMVEISNHLERRQRFLACKYGLWNRQVLRRRFYQSGKPGLSFLRLCDGMSVSEVAQLTTETPGLWDWHSVRSSRDEALRRVFLVSQDGPREPDGPPPIMERVTRRLLTPRARQLNRLQSSLVLRGHTSPVDYVYHKMALLKNSQAYIAPCTAPIPELFIPGDTSKDARVFGPPTQFIYPEMPFRGSQHTTRDVYETWRGLFGNFGAHVGTSSIMMPETGRLVADSGKMVTLDPLLKKLKAEGHKCLIYSQFTKVLDILEDYCGKTQLKYVRLDGQSALADRRDIVAEWQANKELFVFLLSTRAGGVGLNLTAADTVIFFDSDWNPTQDLQAMDRAHRLGQERPVTVYRLISPDTIEERMLFRAQEKSRINDLVIKGGSMRSEEEQARETDVKDIADLLMVEEKQTSLIDPTEGLEIARNAVKMLKDRGRVEPKCNAVLTF